MFTRLPIPTPFQIGPVNAYLAGRTLIDPGPDSEEAWAALLDALEARGLAPGDVERVLVTHPHPDHFGLAKKLRAAGAEVLASDAAADIVGDFAGRLEYEQSYFQGLFERCGMAESTARTVTELPQVFLSYAPSVAVDRRLADGDTVVVDDRAVTVRRVASHAPGEVVFAVDDSGLAVVGDHVLPDYTPNPFLQPPPKTGGERPAVVPAYNRSLDRLRERGYERFLPGHGDPIENPSGRIEEIRDAHETRTGEVAGLLDGPTTPVAVMEGLFEDLPVTEQFAGMSEALGHLDVLVERDLATVTERGGLLLYEPSDQ
jgi:glyoxylase-like metal-dependent hydrolase (beta-lactamase superfamily II)